MPVSVVTMREGYSMYENQRGIDTNFLPFNTPNYSRSGPYYPHTLEEVRNSGTDLLYSDYCSKLAAAQNNLLRVKWDGTNTSTDNGYCGIEPPPYGTYNIWQTALDPDTLATYRSQQVTYPVGAAAWNASNMKEFIEQCAAYNVNILVIPFSSHEFLGHIWTYHAWNTNNYYINGVRCEVADRGFLTNAYDIFTDATAIQAAKDRIDFLVDTLGTNKAVVAWEMVAEMTWLFDATWWGEAGWGPTMVTNIRDKVNPWITEIGNYLRAKDPYNRPIGCGLLRPPPESVWSSWPADPDHYWNVTNEPMVQFPMDFCAMNLYHDTFSECVQHFRMGHAYTDKMLWPTQYSPVGVSPGVIVEELPPYTESKKRLWIGICGERWGLTPLRWPGFREIGHNVWADGGYADSDFYSLPGLVNTFQSNVTWNTWKTNNYVFDDYVVASGTSNLLSYGDGRHVTFHTEFASGGTKSVQLENLESGTYTFTWYDWTAGSVAGSAVGTATSGTFTTSVGVSDLQDNFLVAHLLHN